MAGLKDLAHRLLSTREDAQQSTDVDDAKDRKESAMTNTTLDVEGMSCGHCKAAVEGELDKLEGVERSEADFEKGTVEVRYEESRVSNEDLRSAVETAGYRVVG